MSSIDTIPASIWGNDMQDKTTQENTKQKEALAKLEMLVAKVQTRNQDITEEQAIELADKFTREVIAEMVEDGRIRFKK